VDDITRCFQAINENACCAFETTKGAGGIEVVTEAAPIIRRAVLGKELADAIYILTSRGWTIEIVE
jgi:hypothetical protein